MVCTDNPTHRVRTKHCKDWHWLTAHSRQLILNSSPFPAHAASHVRSRSLAISGKPVLTPPDVFMQTSESFQVCSIPQRQIFKSPVLYPPHIKSHT